jgi:hypothetical protein
MKKPTIKELKMGVLAFITEFDFSGTEVLISNKELEDKKPDTYAETQWDFDDLPTIVINPKRGGLVALIDTLVHESLHVLYPDMLHKDVKSFTKSIVKRLSYEDKEEILVSFAIAAEWRL